MAQAKILVVEDESIVALDLQHRLTGMGYSVPAVAASGQDALKKAAEIHPDLVLMDIRLKGDMDGIEVAEQIRQLFDAPPVYLTAYADEDTLQRAKITEPFGYIVKPFDERTLRSTLETALYRSQAERKLRQSEAWLKAALRSVGEAVIAADDNCRVVLMNPAAETLTGWKQEEAMSHDLSQIFQIASGGTPVPAEDLLKMVCEGRAEADLTNHSLRLARGGEAVPVDGKAVPVLGSNGAAKGIVLGLRKS